MSQEPGVGSINFGKPGRMGCIPFFLVAGIIALAGGIQLMTRWESLTAPVRAGSVVLVVIASFLLVPVVIYYAFKIAARIFLNRLATQFSESAAGQMMTLNKSLYSGPHEFRPAQEDDFQGLDRTYYETTTADLNARGFRHLGDVVDATIQATTTLRVPVRVLSSHDGTTQAAVYDATSARLKTFGTADAPLKMLLCEFGTEFSDGTFLITSTSEQAALASVSPRIRRQFHPADTPPLQLLQLHESEKQKIMAATPQLSCTVCNTLADALALEQRQQEAKNEYRQEIGYVDPEEVRRIAARVSDSE
jgi:hypothetical protein